MTIEHVNGVGFWTYYSNSKILRSFSDWNKNCITFFSDGTERIFHMPKQAPLDPYNEQYGISVSIEKDLFFYQTWTKGLYCFSLSDGTELWHLRLKHAADILVSGSHLLCWFFNYGIVKIAIDSGKVLGRFSLTSELACVLTIDEHYFLAGEKYNSYYLLDDELILKRKYAASELNPYGYDNFLIQNAKLVDGMIVIDGIEGPLSTTIDDESSEARFERHLSI